MHKHTARSDDAADLRQVFPELHPGRDFVIGRSEHTAVPRHRLLHRKGRDLVINIIFFFRIRKIVYMLHPFLHGLLKHRDAAAQLRRRPSDDFFIQHAARRLPHPQVAFYCALSEGLFHANEFGAPAAFILRERIHIRRRAADVYQQERTKSVPASRTSVEQFSCREDRRRRRNEGIVEVLLDLVEPLHVCDPIQKQIPDDLLHRFYIQFTDRGYDIIYYKAFLLVCLHKSPHRDAQLRIAGVNDRHPDSRPGKSPCIVQDELHIAVFIPAAEQNDIRIAFRKLLSVVLCHPAIIIGHDLRSCPEGRRFSGKSAERTGQTDHRHPKSSRRARRSELQRFIERLLSQDVPDAPEALLHSPPGIGSYRRGHLIRQKQFSVLDIRDDDLGKRAAKVDHDRMLHFFCPFLLYLISLFTPRAPESPRLESKDAFMI